jgi:hypothetical protein
MSRRTRTLRLLSWVVLVVGAAGAVLLVATSRETVETTRTIFGHATLRFQDVEVRISVAKIALALASLALSGFLWALGRAVADLADAAYAG